MRTGAWLFLGLLFLSACAGPRPLKWSVTFPGGTPTPSSVALVHAEVRTGSTCAPNDGTARVFWDVPADHSAPFGMGQDMHLPAGTYYLYVEARDASCTPLFTGCQMVTFPTDAQQTVPLTAVSGAPASCSTMCSNGRCTGMTLPDLGMDAGPPDTGTMMDMPMSEGGGSCNGCMMAGSCQAGIANAACGSGGVGCSTCGSTTECLDQACVTRVGHFAMSAVTTFFLKPTGQISSAGGDTFMQRGHTTAGPAHGFSAMTDPPGVGTATEIASAQYATFAIDNAGHLWSWGSTAFGILGGGGAGGPMPGQVGSTTYASVTAGDQHVCALRTDGALFCWGSGANGRVGNGSTTNVTAPARIEVTPGSMDTWLAVSAGYAHTCAIRSDRALFCWGMNDHGQLGNGAMDPDMMHATPRPARVGTESDWTYIAAAIGGSFTCGIRAGGHRWCWGGNANGELGDGDNTDSTTPVEEDPTSMSWSAVSGGQFHACGIRMGTLLCWGSSVYGALGHAGTTSDLLPAVVMSGTRWLNVTAGWDWTCGTKDDTTSYCWGKNSTEQLGIGMDMTTTPMIDTPTAIAAP